MSTTGVGQKLQRFFDLRPGETGPLIFFFTHSLFLGLFVTAFFSAANVLFLARFEIRFLPYAYVVSGVLGFVVGSFFGFLQRHLSFGTLMTATLISLTGVTVLLRFGLSRSTSDIVPFLVFALVLPMVTLLQLEFWGLANRFFHLEQGKRLFGLISSGDVVSSIVGFLALVHIIRWVNGVENLLWLATIGLLGCLIMFVWISTRYHRQLAEQGFAGATPGQDPIKKIRGRARVGKPQRDRFMVLIYAVSLCTVLAMFFVDYAFMGEIRANFGTGEGLARFIGIFFGLAKILELIFKTTVSGRALRQYGMRLGVHALPTSLVPPILLAAIATFFLATAEGSDEIVRSGFAAAIFFVMIAIAKLVDRLARKSIEDPAFKLLFLPLPQNQRLPAQSSVEAVRHGAQAIAGVVLVGLVSLGLGRASVVIWFAAVLLVVWIALAERLYRAYRVKVVDTLSGHGGTSLSQSILERWVADLRDADPFEVGHSLRLLQKVAPALVFPLAERLRRDGSGEVRRAVSESLDTLRSSQALQLGAIGQLGDRDPAELSDELIRLAESEEPKERIRAARMVSLIGDVGGTGVLTLLLGDRDPGVVRSALDASIKVQDVDLHSRIVQLLFRPEICGIASSTLIQLGEPILSLVERLFRQRNVPTAVLLRALKIYGQIGGEKASRLLFDKLNHGEIAVRDEALEALGGSGFKARPGDLSFVSSRLDEVVEQIAWLLASILDLTEKEGFEKLEAALRSELDHHQLQIFLYLSLLYDREAIELAKDHYDSGSPEGRAFALEIIDVLVSPQIKEKLSPLIEDLTELQKLRRLEADFPQQQLLAKDRVRDILTVGYSRVDRWTRIHAVRTLISLVQEPSDELLANLYNPDAMTREEAAIGVLEKDSELFMDHWNKMRPASRRELGEFLGVRSGEVAKGPVRLSVYDKTCLLQNSAIFKEVPAAGLIRLAEEARERSLEDGQVLFEKGDSAENIYVVIDGELGVWDDGVLINREEAGDIVGEIAVVEVSDRSAGVKATQNTRLLEIAGDSLFNLMADHVEVIHTVLGVIARRRRRSQTFAAAG